MKNKISLIIITLVLANFLLSGCIGVNRGFKSLRNHIVENVDGDYERVIEFSVGPAGILLASMFVSFADTEENIDDMLRQVSRVQVSIYEKKGNGSSNPSMSLLCSLSKRLEDRGWQYLVRSVDGDEMVGVFIRSDEPEELNQIFVVALSDKELVMTEVLGDLDDLIEIAIRQHGLDFDMAHN